MLGSWLYTVDMAMLGCLRPLDMDRMGKSRYRVLGSRNYGEFIVVAILVMTRLDSYLAA